MRITRYGWSECPKFHTCLLLYLLTIAKRSLTNVADALDDQTCASKLTLLHLADARGKTLTILGYVNLAGLLCMTGLAMMTGSIASGTTSLTSNSNGAVTTHMALAAAAVARERLTLDLSSGGRGSRAVSSQVTSLVAGVADRSWAASLLGWS
jgi:hypothetical protein